MFTPHIYKYPFVVVMPVKLIEIRTHAPVVTVELDAGPLLRAIYDEVQDCLFTCSELKHGSISNRKLGKLLRKIVDEGKSYDGLRVVCDDNKEDNAQLWQVIYE